jgi:predicted NBD/HSP70 family sugar kinase
VTDVTRVTDVAGTVPGTDRRVLVVDVGGSHIKCLVPGETEERKFDSGPDLGPVEMVAGVLEHTADWTYDVISIGYPGPVRNGRPAVEPHNLAPGWVGFDYEQAFGTPVRMLNDAAMQALGSYHGGSMLFLGFGTGLGAAFVIQGNVQPLELAHLPWRDGRTYEEWTGDAALERDGEATWRANVLEVIELFRAAFQPDYIVAGGGNVRLLKELPEGVERGNNDNAFVGGYALWRGE